MKHGFGDKPIECPKCGCKKFAGPTFSDFRNALVFVCSRCGHNVLTKTKDAHHASHD